MEYRPPASLHEAEIERWQPRDPMTGELQSDADLQTLAGAMASARRDAERLAALAAALQGDPRRTPEGAAVELRRAALEIGERSAQTLDAARSRAVAALKTVEAETAAPPPPRDAVQLQIEAELRAKLAALPQAKRRALITEAIDSGDDTLPGAILRGPALLTGLTPEEHALIREQWRAARHPERAAKIARLTKALEATELGGNLLVSYVERLTTSDRAKAAQRKAAATEAALKAVKAAE
jgi:hypothetical protein